MKSNYAAWHIPTIELDALSPVERLKHLLGYAILAPSAHNTQPWEFVLDATANKIGVALDVSRTLSQSDPTHRQAYMSLGAAIENICVAAKAYGAVAKVSYPRRKNYVAELSVKWPTTSSPIDRHTLQAIIHRHTNRSAYKKEKIPQEALNALTQIQSPGTSVHTITTASTQKKVAAIAREAALAQMDSSFKQELSEWVHHNWTDEFIGMPAGVQGIPGPVSLAAKFIVSKAPIEKDQAKKDASQLAAAPVLIAICAVDDDQRHWLEAGRIFERVCLDASAYKLSTSAYATTIESSKSREKLQKVLGTSEYPLALLRVGYAKKRMPLSPRLPVDKVIMRD